MKKKGAQWLTGILIPSVFLWSAAYGWGHSHMHRWPRPQMKHICKSDAWKADAFLFNKLVVVDISKCRFVIILCLSRCLCRSGRGNMCWWQRSHLMPNTMWPTTSPTNRWVNCYNVWTIFNESCCNTVKNDLSADGLSAMCTLLTLRDHSIVIKWINQFIVFYTYY